MSKGSTQRPSTGDKEQIAANWAAFEEARQKRIKKEADE